MDVAVGTQNYSGHAMNGLMKSACYRLFEIDLFLDLAFPGQGV